MKPDRIFELRKLTETNQTDFGSLIGVGLRTVQKLEKGESIPNGKALLKLMELDAQYPTQIGEENKKPSYKGLSFEEIILFILKNEDEFMSHKGFKNMVEIRVAKAIAKISASPENFKKWLKS